MKQIIKKELLKMQDKKFKTFHEKLCPNTKNIIGIKIPVLKSYAKELLKNNSFEELIKEIDDEYYEEIMLQAILIGYSKKEFRKIIPYIEKFIPKIDNWAVCDTFCAGLKLTKKNKKEMWNFIQTYLKSDKEFELRFAIVMLIDYYIEESYIKEIFKILEKIDSDKYYVKMAISWAISICFIKFYDETKKFIKKAELEDFIYNKSLQKAIESLRITKEQKEELRKLKR